MQETQDLAAIMPSDDHATMRRFDARDSYELRSLRDIACAALDQACCIPEGALRLLLIPTVTRMFQIMHVRTMGGITGLRAFEEAGQQQVVPYLMRDRNAAATRAVIASRKRARETDGNEQDGKAPPSAAQGAETPKPALAQPFGGGRRRQYRGKGGRGGGATAAAPAAAENPLSDSGNGSGPDVANPTA